MLSEQDYLQLLAKAVSVGSKAVELAKSKRRFNPFSSPLLEGDIITLDIVDKDGNLVFATDERTGTYVLAHLTRKGRKAAYSFYPSMLVRYYQVAIEGVGKSEGEPEYIQNDGIPSLVGNESIEEFVALNYVGASIQIKKIRRVNVWKFQRDAYRAGKHDYKDEDFEVKKGNIYTFLITQNAVSADALIKLSKTTDELFADATAPQIS